MGIGNCTFRFVLRFWDARHSALVQEGLLQRVLLWSTHRLARLGLFEGGREADGRDHGLRGPPVGVLAGMGSQRREVGEVLLVRLCLLGHPY